MLSDPGLYPGGISPLYIDVAFITLEMWTQDKSTILVTFPGFGTSELRVNPVFVAYKIPVCLGMKRSSTESFFSSFPPLGRLGFSTMQRGTGASH